MDLPGVWRQPRFLPKDMHKTIATEAPRNGAEFVERHRLMTMLPQIRLDARHCVVLTCPVAGRRRALGVAEQEPRAISRQGLLGERCRTGFYRLTQRVDRRKQAGIVCLCSPEMRHFRAAQLAGGIFEQVRRKKHRLEVGSFVNCGVGVQFPRFQNHDAAIAQVVYRPPVAPVGRRGPAGAERVLLVIYTPRLKRPVGDEEFNPCERLGPQEGQPLVRIVADYRIAPI